MGAGARRKDTVIVLNSRVSGNAVKSVRHTHTHTGYIKFKMKLAWI